MTAPNTSNDLYSSYYPENTLEAAQIARLALPLASKLKLPANPISYAVLYQHVSGKNPGLSQAINQLRDTSEQLSVDRILSLYETFIDLSDKQTVDNFRNELLVIIEATQNTLGEANKESKTYQSELNSGATLLKNNSNSDDLVKVIAALIEETDRMQHITQTLNEKLAKTNAELTQLRADFQKAHKDALIDPLTGCANRDKFDNTLNQLVNAANSNGEKLCLLLIDIDHFKRVNDTFSHLTGDEVLKWIALHITKFVRGNDFVARFGGGEFAVLLPNTPMEGAELVADNICSAIKNRPMQGHSPTQKIGRITVSVGVSLYQPGEDAEQFISRCDNALCHAKSSGRSRVCTHN